MNLKTVIILFLFMLTTNQSRSQISSAQVRSLTSEFNELLKLQKGSSVQLMLPISKIAEEEFTITESASALPKSLQDKYPDIKSFTGYSSSSELTLTLHKNKFYGVLKRGNQIIELKEIEFSDLKKSAHHINVPFEQSKLCAFKKSVVKKNQSSTLKTATNVSRGNQLRTYTIVVTLTGRQSQSMGFTTKEEGLAYVNYLVNTINSVYKRELAVEFQLHPENEKVIYLDPLNDPYPDRNVNDMMSIIGTNNTNIFELFDSDSFHTGLVIHPSNIGRGGGRPCNNSRATVGSCACIGLILHELGHHLGGVHTYDLDRSDEVNALQRSMIGNNSTYLHALNFEGISNTIIELNDCGKVTDANNSAPEIEVNIDGKVIPKNTPFVLTAHATDLDPDANLTYTWQQMHVSKNEETKLLFAHETPNEEGNTRYVPSLESQLENSDDDHTILPEVDRNISVGILVRDNQIPVGATSFKQIELRVDASAGPFVVTHPNTFIELESGTEFSIQWNVANTDNEQVNAQEVAISISYDGGNYWETLVSNTPNDGNQTFLVPEVESNECRIKVAAVDHIFYDLNDENFKIYLNNSIADNSENEENFEDVEDEEETEEETEEEDMIDEENEIEVDDDNLTIPLETELEEVKNDEPSIAQAFTPNNDGLNDFWVINKIEMFSNNTVRVFDKMGKEVFSALGYQNDWSGKDKNTAEQLPPGPYYYNIKLGEKTSTKTGWLFINY